MCVTRHLLDKSLQKKLRCIQNLHYFQLRWCRFFKWEKTAYHLESAPAHEPGILCQVLCIWLNIHLEGGRDGEMKTSHRLLLCGKHHPHLPCLLLTVSFGYRLNTERLFFLTPFYETTAGHKHNNVCFNSRHEIRVIYKQDPLPGFIRRLFSAPG